MNAPTLAKMNWLPALGSTLIIVLVAMDLFMTPIATTALTQELDTDASMVQGAIALFSLVLAALCILGGKLGDIYGKKKVFMIGLAIYGIAALITALAPSMLVLILGFSLVRAVAVALAVPASVALIIANYEDQAQRGKAFALYGVGMMVAGLLAPLLMGFMADKLSWRIPFGLEVIIVLVAFFLARPMRETATIKVKVDVLGTILVFLAVGSIVLGGMLGGAGALPMFVVGLGFGVVVTQTPNVQLSTLPARLQGEGSGLAETAKAIGVGLGTAVIGSVMFGLALGGMVDKVATQVQVELTFRERAELIVQIEDERVPQDVEELVAEQVPNLEALTREAYVEAFQITLGVLVAIVLLALLMASLIPKVVTEDIDNQQLKAAEATRETG